jgi:TRAP-type C4-dicarboxylate transport system substrate-binding protein
MSAEIKVALDSPPSLEKSGSYNWAHVFTEHLKANGLEAKEYPRGALGEENEKLDQVSQGLLEVSMSDLAKIGQLDHFIFGFNSPFLFEGTPHMDRMIAATDVMEQINKRINGKGVRLLAVVPVGTAAGIFTTTKSIKTLDDMKGLRIRALDQNQVAFFKALGANPVVVSWSEVPNALQTGIAEGYTNPAFVPLLFGHTAFIKHYLHTAQSPSLRVAMASEDWYQSLSAAQKKVVQDAVKKADAANRAWLDASRKVVFQQLEAEGVAVTIPSKAELQRFAEASRPTWTAILSKDEVQYFIDGANKTR